MRASSVSDIAERPGITEPVVSGALWVIARAFSGPPAAVSSQSQSGHTRYMFNIDWLER